MVRDNNNREIAFEREREEKAKLQRSQYEYPRKKQTALQTDEIWRNMRKTGRRGGVLLQQRGTYVLTGATRVRARRILFFPTNVDRASWVLCM